MLLECSLVDEASLTVGTVGMVARAQMLFKRVFACKAPIAVSHRSQSSQLYTGLWAREKVFVDEPLLAITAVGMDRRLGTEMLRERMLAELERSSRAQYSLVFVRMGRPSYRS
jgi:hypothetical protein